MRSPPGETMDGELDALSEAAAIALKGAASADRRHIMEQLVSRPLSLPQLVELTGLAPSSIAHHVQVLCDCGLAEVRLSKVRAAPQGLWRLRSYFDMALLAATRPHPGAPSGRRRKT